MAILLVLGATTPSGRPHAGVTPDGSLGTTVALTPGQTYVVGGGTRVVGGSFHGLFHSFDQFSVNVDETVIFGDPNPVTDVIGRVTGGSPSIIDGLIRSEIAGANLYLINPAGMAFHENAEVELTGSLFVSTADYLLLGTDGRFDATNTNETILTAAPPSAFGFLGGEPGSMSFVGGAGSNIGTVPGQDLVVVGGDVSIVDHSIHAADGRVTVVSVASSGEIVIGDDLSVDGFQALGTVEIRESRRLSDQPVPALYPDGHIANLDASGESGGTVRIRAGRLVVDEGQIFSDTFGGGSGGHIDAYARDEIRLSGAAVLTAQATTAASGGTDRSIRLRAGELNLAGGSVITIVNFATSTVGVNRGRIELIADESISLSDSQVGAGTFQGAGGEVEVRTPTLRLEGASFISANTGFPGGDGGLVSLEVDDLQLLDGARISTSTKGAGDGGRISVVARHDIVAVGTGSGFFSSAQAPPFGGIGNGGDIELTSARLILSEHAAVSASNEAGGDAGSVSVTATDNIRLDGQAAISTESGQGGGGEIRLAARTRLVLTDSGISSSVADGRGNGGNIRIDSEFVVLNRSSITANAAAGAGGNISIAAGHVLVSPDSRIDASSELGIDGEVTVNSPAEDLSGNLAELPANFTPRVDSSLTPCSQRSGADVIELVARRYDVLPDSPYALRAHTPPSAPSPVPAAAMEGAAAGVGDEKREQAGDGRRVRSFVLCGGMRRREDAST